MQPQQQIIKVQPLEEELPPEQILQDRPIQQSTTTDTLKSVDVAHYCWECDGLFVRQWMGLVVGGMRPTSTSPASKNAYFKNHFLHCFDFE
jgi:hypothetical protein